MSTLTTPTFECLCGKPVDIPAEYRRDFGRFKHLLLCSDPVCPCISIVVNGELKHQYRAPKRLSFEEAAGLHADCECQKKPAGTLDLEKCVFSFRENDSIVSYYIHTIFHCLQCTGYRITKTFIASTGTGMRRWVSSPY